MRLWLRESERRPSPSPATTDDRKPFIVGTIAWATVFLAAILAHNAHHDSSLEFWVASCAAGTGFGVVGTAYTLVLHARSPTKME